MILISSLFLIFIFSIQTIEATGPKDLNPAKTKAEANLSQNPAMGPEEMRNLSLNLQGKQAILKAIILEDASSFKSLDKTEKQAIQSELDISENNYISSYKITVQDDQLKSDGMLKDFIENPKNINILFDDNIFKGNLFEYLKPKNPYLNASFKIYIKIINKASGEFEIIFFKTESKEDGFKELIMEDILSATLLSDDDKELIQNQEGFNRENLIIQGFKITVQDNELKPDGILSSVFNEKTLNIFLNQYIFMETIQSHLERNNKSIYGKATGYIKSINQEQGEVEILFYTTQNKALKPFKDLIIENLANCRDLEETELQALKNNYESKGIYDGKYISKACEISIQNNLLKEKEENDIEELFDIHFKKEIADRLSNPNLRLDKYMSIYTVFNKDEGSLILTLADTRSLKEAELIKVLEILKEEPEAYINKKQTEEKYGVKYVNLGIFLYWEDEDDRFKSGQEFDKSFELINEIINTRYRKDLIDKVNETLKEKFASERLFPNNSNTILRSQLDVDKQFIIHIFTQTQSLKEAFQNNILGHTDANIKAKKYNYNENFYESISNRDDITNFEAGRSLKQGLKFNEIYENRLETGGNLSSYYNNSEAMDKLLDDADFKLKILAKINDYQQNNEEFKETINFVFSRDNLDNIKIKAQNFRKENEFELVVYELNPQEESDSTDLSSGESAAADNTDNTVNAPAPADNTDNTVNAPAPADNTDNTVNVPAPAANTDNTVNAPAPAANTDNTVNVPAPAANTDNTVNVPAPADNTDNTVNAPAPADNTANTVNAPAPADNTDNTVNAPAPADNDDDDNDDDDNDDDNDDDDDNDGE